MQSAASPDLYQNTKSRPRPIGSGRLSAWRLLEGLAPAPRALNAVTSASFALVSDGLDPVIEDQSPSALTMSFGQIARFRIDFNALTVSLIAAHPQTDQDTVDHLVDDHVAPRLIAASGALVLHGSACVIGNQMAVFLGQTGSGKSTLSASLHAAGYQLLGDDAVVISTADGTILGEAVYPSLRLYRESIDQVFSHAVGTAAMAFYSDKLHVVADTLTDQAPEKVAVRAIYVLTEGDTGVTLELISPADACMSLVENSFALDPLDPVAAAQRMALAAQVAAEVPCYELAYPYDFALLPDVRAAVIASLTGSECAA